MKIRLLVLLKRMHQDAIFAFLFDICISKTKMRKER
jgi:hypothetical protein